MFTAEHYESGLAARFLLAMPPKRAKQWTGREVSRMTEDLLARVFANLWSLAPVSGDRERTKPMDLPLADDAQPEWIAFVNAHGRETADLAGPLGAAFSKLEGYAARLALVLCLAEWAEDPGKLGIGPAAIDVESLRAGIALAEWAKGETRRIYEALTEGEEDQGRREILELVGRRGGTITVRELQQTRRFGDAEECEAVLDELAAGGLGRWESTTPGPRGGRPPRRFHLNETPGFSGKNEVT
jgi:hypothetical protein